MISVEWFDNETCDNCKREKQPHCAQVNLIFDEDNPVPLASPESFTMMLCSDCVEDLKKRLS